MEIIGNIEFKLSQNIFSKGMHLKGSTKMDSNLDTTKERLCRDCLEYNNPKPGMCIPIGKIKNPNTVIYCSWYKTKYIKRYKSKRCCVCGFTKTINKFYKDKSSPDGHQYKCCKCAINYGIEYQRNNKKVRGIIGV